MRRILTCLMAVNVLISLTLPAMAEDQPQWGEAWTRNLVSPEKGLPETFDPGDRDHRTGEIVLPEGSGVKWVAQLGAETCGSPVVAGGRVYVGTNNDAARDPRIQIDYGILMCFDEQTGEFLWQLAVPKLMKIKWADWRYVGICSAPSVQGDRVYLVSNRCEVLCLDAKGMADGNDGPYKDEAKHMVAPGQQPLEPNDKSADILWVYDMNAELGVEPHNASCSSVVIDGDYLYVGTSNGVEWTHKFVVNPGAPSLICLDKNTGKLVARDDFGIDGDVTHGQWSSPAMAEIDGKKHVYFGGGNGYLYAAEGVGVDGKNVDPPKNPGESPRLKTVWKFNGNPLAKTQDVRPDHQHDSTSFQVTSNPVFHKDHVYVVFTQEPFHQMREGRLSKLKTDGTGDTTRTGGEVWAFEDLGSSCSTPAVADGLVYVCNFWGELFCLDEQTGKVYWTCDVGRPVWGSPYVADGKVYIGTGRNYFTVLRAGKQLEEIGQIRVRDQILTTPVAANGVLFIATNRHLYAVGGKKP